MKKRLWWAILCSTAFTVILLLKVDWAHFASITDRLSIKELLIAVVIFAAGNVVRAFRFYKLDHIGNSLGRWLVINQVYNFMTSTLPGGAGEAGTAYLLKRFSTFNMMSAFRILLLARLMDLAGLSALLFITAISISGTVPYREIAIWVSGVAFIASIIFTHPKSEQFIIKLLQKMRVNGRIMDRLYERLEDIARISEERLNTAFFGATMLQSVLIIIASALTVHFVLLSVGTGFTLIQGLYCFGVYAVFQMFPVQGIAGIGTQAAWWALALTAAGYNASDTIALGIVLHGTFYALITIMGFFVLLIWLMIRRSN